MSSNIKRPLCQDGCYFYSKNGYFLVGKAMFQEDEKLIGFDGENFSDNSIPEDVKKRIKKEYTQQLKALKWGMQKVK